jgi:spermidine synthase
MKKTILFLALLFSGASALIYEVVSTKALFFFFASTTYTVATVLAAFLLGLALGSLIIAKNLHWIENKRNMFVWVQLFIGAYALLFLMRFDSIPVYLDFLYKLAGNHFYILLLSKFVVSLGYLIMPTLMLGASFPLITSLVVKKVEDSAKDVGLLYSFDTFGAILGAVLAGFFLVPVLGLKITVVVGAGLNFLSAFLIVEKKRKNIFGLSLAVVAIFLVAYYLNMSRNPKASAPTVQAGTAQLSKPNQPPQGKLFEKNTPYGMLAVIGQNDEVVLFIDNRDQCRQSLERKDFSELQISRFALAKFTGPIDVMNIGLGCGLTLGTALENPNVKQVDVIEINPMMKTVAKDYFGKFNGHAVDNPKTNLIFDDGAHYLMESQKKYDAVIIDVENPAILYSSPLYTKEYFEAVSKRLNEGGVFGLWVFSGNADYYSVIYHTLKTAFPYVYFKDFDNAFFLASGSPIPDDVVAQTEQEKNMHKYFDQQKNSEINSIDKPVLQKYNVF